MEREAEIRVDLAVLHRGHVGRESLAQIAIFTQEIELAAGAADEHVRTRHARASRQVEADEGNIPRALSDDGAFDGLGPRPFASEETQQRRRREHGASCEEALGEELSSSARPGVILQVQGGVGIEGCLAHRVPLCVSWTHGAGGATSAASPSGSS